MQGREVDALFNGGLISIGRHWIDADFGRRHLHDRSSFAETLRMASIGNPPLEPRGLEVEFFPKEEVLHEKVQVHG